MSTVPIHLPKWRKIALPKVHVSPRRRRTRVSWLAIAHAADIPPGS